MEHSRADAYNALDALAGNVRDTDNYGMFCKDELKSLIDDYFSIVDHLKQTSLWDVLTYESRLESPLRILTTDNERLKKENNRLLKELGRTEKYRKMRKHKTESSYHFNVGDTVFSNVLNKAGCVTRVDFEAKTAVVDFRVGHGPNATFSCRFAELRKI